MSSTYSVNMLIFRIFCLSVHGVSLLHTLSIGYESPDSRMLGYLLKIWRSMKSFGGTWHWTQYWGFRGWEMKQHGNQSLLILTVQYEYKGSCPLPLLQVSVVFSQRLMLRIDVFKIFSKHPLQPTVCISSRLKDPNHQFWRPFLFLFDGFLNYLIIG